MSTWKPIRVVDLGMLRLFFNRGFNRASYDVGDEFDRSMIAGYDGREHDTIEATAAAHPILVGGRFHYLFEYIL